MKRFPCSKMYRKILYNMRSEFPLFYTRFYILELCLNISQEGQYYTDVNMYTACDTKKGWISYIYAICDV